MKVKKMNKLTSKMSRILTAKNGGGKLGESILCFGWRIAIVNIIKYFD